MWQIHFQGNVNDLSGRNVILTVMLFFVSRLGSGTLLKVVLNRNEVCLLLLSVPMYIIKFLSLVFCNPKDILFQMQNNYPYTFSAE